MILTPLIVTEILSGLGFGEQVVVGAVLVITVLYLFRARSAAGKTVTLASTVWTVAVAVLAAGSLAIFLGWVDPSPGKMMADLFGFFQWLVGVFWDTGVDAVDGLIP